MLSDKAIQDFKKLYKSKFGIDISDNQALDMGSNLVNICRVIYAPNIKISKNEKKSRPQKN